MVSKSTQLFASLIIPNEDRRVLAACNTLCRARERNDVLHIVIVAAQLDRGYNGQFVVERDNRRGPVNR